MVKTIYESPSVKILEVRVEGKILDGSITATRRSYTVEAEEEWE